MIDSITVYTDASVSERYRTMSCAWVIVRNDRTVKTGSIVEGAVNSPNSTLGEIAAIHHALKDLVKLRLINHSTKVLCDNQGAIASIASAQKKLSTFGDEWMPALPCRIAARDVAMFARRFRHLAFKYIPRSQNYRADAESKTRRKHADRMSLRKVVTERACASLDVLARELGDGAATGT